MQRLNPLVLLWPTTSLQAIVASTFAIAIVSFGSINPWAMTPVALLTGSYNAWVMGIYELSLTPCVFLFSSNVILWVPSAPCARYAAIREWERDLLS